LEWIDPDFNGNSFEKGYLFHKAIAYEPPQQSKGDQ